MNWQQQQLLANQRRIREFQAQQNVINSHGGQYISPRAGSSGYVPATMYHPSQQSYVYPPTTQWTVMDQASPQMASHYAPGYGQQYYSPHYYQRQMPNTAVPPPPPPPTMPRPNAHSAPWHSSQVVSAPPLSKPSGKGLTYAELLSKALPATITSPQQQMSAEHRPMHDNQTQASLRASPVPKPPAIELPKPPPPPSAKPESDAYPPSLLKYVERAFLQCKSDAEKSEIQKLLKLRIQTAKQNGVLWTQDWENMALPHVPSPIGAKRKSESKLSKKQQKKLKKQQALMAAAAGAITPVGIKGVSSTTDSKLMTLPVNDVAVKLRSARFGTSLLNDVSSSISSRPLTLFHNRLRNENGDGDIELDWEALKISGTCDQLEKKYLRLTSAPDPSTVRPLQILRKSFDHILKKWLDDRNYLFFWEQMKSLRQDLTIQHIIDPFVIQVYETNARVCLEVDDLSEYNQCQTQLSELYDNHNIKDSCKSNMDEFLGYRLLYLLLTNDPMSVSLMLHDTTPTERQQDALSHAIATLRAFRTNDFCRFFELASSAPLQSFQIIRHLYPTVRHNALLRITAAFRPTLPVAALSNMLGFGDQDSCRTWLLASGVVLDQSRDNIVCKESNIVRAQLSANDSQEIVGVTHGTF